MSLARLVVTAVRIEGRTKAEVSRDYGVSPRWVYELCRRFDAEGEAGLEPRSRRPREIPHRTPSATENEIVELRKDLLDQGFDAGAHTIAVRTVAPGSRGARAVPTQTRQGRHHRGRDAPPQLTAASHRARAQAHRHEGPSPRRCPAGSGDHRGRRATPGADPGPESRLPTPWKIELNVERCPETYRHDVPRHHTAETTGFEPVRELNTP
jgi:hypothetical protein